MEVPEYLEKQVRDTLADIKKLRAKPSDMTAIYTLGLTEFNQRTLSSIKRYGKVLHEYPLIKSVSVEVSVDNILKLLKKNYVLRAEPDRGVSVLQITA